MVLKIVNRTDGTYNVRVVCKGNVLRVGFVHKLKYVERDDFFEWMDVTKTPIGKDVTDWLTGRPTKAERDAEKKIAKIEAAGAQRKPPYK